MKQILCTLFALIFASLSLNAWAFEQVTYVHSDGQGKPVAGTDENGNKAWTIEYYPFGGIYNDTASERENDLGFAYKPFDAGTGLSYFGARHYDPSLGRFTGIDPVGVNPSDFRTFNRYSYGFNNPNAYVDPDGRFPVDTFWDAASIVYDIGKITVGYATNNQKLIVDGTVDLAADATALLIPYVPAGSSKVARATGEAVGEGYSATKSAEAAADAALAGGKKSGAAAELRVGDKVFTAVSGEKVVPNSNVTGALMGTPASARKPWHGGCAEIACLDKALNAGVNPKGGSIRAVNIGVSGKGHGTSKKICSSCNDVLNHLGVKGQ